MGTAHGDGLEEAFNRKTFEDPKWALIAAETRNRLNASFYSQWIVDACFQLPEIRGKISLTDAFGFAVLYSNLFSGQIAHFKVKVGEEPWANKEIELNQSALNKLPDPFSATFDPERGRGADSDGSFAWSRSVEAALTFVEPDDSERIERRTLPKASIALEVGTTNVSKTLWHMRRSGVARWAYGSKQIVVLVPSNLEVKNRLSESVAHALLRQGIPPVP